MTSAVALLPCGSNSCCLTESEATRWARAFATSLPNGTMVALHGDLGAGKTTMARALCEGAAVMDVTMVTSPTYAIIHEYQSRNGVIVHADLYRVNSIRDLKETGWDDVVANAYLTIVEWPEQVAEAISDSAIHIFLEHDESCVDARRVRLEQW